MIFHRYHLSNTSWKFRSILITLGRDIRHTRLGIWLRSLQQIRWVGQLLSAISLLLAVRIQRGFRWLIYKGHDNVHLKFCGTEKITVGIAGRRVARSRVPDLNWVWPLPGALTLDPGNLIGYDPPPIISLGPQPEQVGMYAHWLSIPLDEREIAILWYAIWCFIQISVLVD